MTESSQSPPDVADPPRGARTGAARGEGSVSHEMRTLSDVIRNLEDQLDAMIASNDALKQELEQERERRLALEDQLAELRQRLRRAEQEAAGRENLSAEAQHANLERSRLATQLREAQEALEQEQRARRAERSASERLRAAREDTLEELASVESQFERAMGMVADAQAKLAIANEEREALEGRLQITEDRLRQAETERDYLLGEVEQSRAALDDIRRSLVDASVASGSAAGRRGAGEEPA